MTDPRIITLGHTEMPFDVAKGYLEEYTSEREPWTPAVAYSFPVYDELATGSGPDELNDGDLMAPIMLNVGISITSMYGLRRVKAQLQAALIAIKRADVRLADTSENDLKRLIEPIYAVLDGTDRPHGIGMTKLSKLVHRKRPGLLVLHDTFVEQTYFGHATDVESEKPRIIYVKRRKPSAKMVELHKEIRRDLIAAGNVWNDLRVAVPAAKDLSDVRILDILVWSAGAEKARAVRKANGA